MSLRWRLGLFVPVALVIVAVSGPRAEVRITDAPASWTVSTPREAEAWIDSTEALVPDLVPGTEKRIVWADSTEKARTPFVVIYVHGFSASRQEVAPLVDSLAARVGANALYLRLRGHGRGPAAMSDGSVEAWTGDLHEAMALARPLGDRVILVGTSMGGSLSIWTASRQEYQSRIAAVALISPGIEAADPASGLVLGPWGMQLARAIVGDTAGFEPANEGQRRFWTWRYPVEILPEVVGMLRVARATAGTAFPFPLLVQVAADDPVTDADATRGWFGTIAAEPKSFIEWRDTPDLGDHVLAGDILAPEATPRVLEAIAEFLAENGVHGAG